MDRKKVLLLFGGESSEHEVSIASATNVYAALDKEKYEVLLCYIDKSGKWRFKDTFEQYQDDTQGVALMPLLGEKAFVTSDGKRIAPDVLLPILHGRNGEDGSVQGLAQLLHIPIVGCDVEASALAMDKVVCKELLEAQSIKTSPYIIYRSGQTIPDFKEVTKKLGNFLFVKPSRAGSSVGVSQVNTEAELHTAIHEAEKHDSLILIEKGIVGRELEVAVLGTPPHHKTSDVGEIIPTETFYSYEAKYSQESQTKTLVAIELDASIREKMRSLSGQIYEIIGCSGLARIDFLLSNEGEIYLNELNTLPGFTNISMYPKLWEAQGISYSELLDQLLNDALRRDTIKA